MNEKIEHVCVTVIHADGTSEKKDRVLLREHSLTICVNGKTACRLVCTRDRIKELVTGRLYTDRLIRSTKDIRELVLSPDESEARVSIDAESKKKPFPLQKQAEGSDRHAPLSEWIFRLAGAFQADAPIHQMTLSTHSCILAREGNILFSCEDIGRHNVIDKTVGYALCRGIPLSECILYISGRLPVDMTEKVIAAGIPVLVTKASPTADSAALAKKHGLTIICRAYPDRYEIISSLSQE